MPKPIFGDNGLIHPSFTSKDDEPLFAGTNYAGLSDTALHAIGGISTQGDTAFTNPTINSYKRLVPGYEAPESCLFTTQPLGRLSDSDV